MALKGLLSKFSLPEVFQFLEQGYKTGLLTVKSLENQLSEQEKHYIWLQQGRIVAAANRLDNKGLLSMIVKRGLVSANIINQVVKSSRPNTALGLSLKSEGLLPAEQLKLLFRNQINAEVCPLFQLSDGEFEFNFTIESPSLEMTGLSLPATEATLIGLRMLRDWSNLVNKLPEMTSGLKTKIIAQPQIILEPIELRVWEYANGKTSLLSIAKELELSKERTQQIALRLIVSNLAEEIFLVSNTSVIDNFEENLFDDFDSTNAFGETSVTQSLASYTPTKQINPQELAPIVRNKSSPTTANQVTSTKANSSNKANVSQSFLQNLVGFLQSKSLE
jgi:Domain of unknown function (DUF4388)